MLFLANESYDFGLVSALRDEGHNVAAISEISPRITDDEVIQLAAREHRILLTEDKDFGQLVFAHGREIRGIAFIRYPGRARKMLFIQVLRLVKKHGKKLHGCFVVVELGHVRFRRPSG